MRLCDRKGNTIHSFAGSKETVRAVTVSADGHRREVVLWDSKKLKLMARLL